MKSRLWTVYLTGGRQCPYTQQVAFLGTRLERPVAVKVPWMPAYYLGYGSHIYIETYEVVAADPLTMHARADYRGLRRSCELPRHFDPARLPE